jgi:hypothetical protein
VGSFSWAVLPGKIMFRDMAYVTPDYTIRVQDGFLVFRWWRAYVPKDVSEDLSHSDTRLSVQVDADGTKTQKRSFQQSSILPLNIFFYSDLNKMAFYNALGKIVIWYNALFIKHFVGKILVLEEMANYCTSW